MPNLFHWMLACLLPTHLGDTPSSVLSNAQNPFLLLVQIPTNSDPPALSVCQIWAIYSPGDARRAQWCRCGRGKVKRALGTQ